MFNSGVFWGIMILIFGIILIVKHIFNLEFPVFKVMLGVFLIMLGIKFLFFNRMNFSFSDDNNVVFGSKDMNYTEGNYEYNVVFSSSTLDLRNITESPKRRFEMNAVFGDMKVLLSKDARIDLNSDAVFGSVQQPSSPEAPVLSDSIQVEPPLLKIKASAVFGNIQFIRIE